VHEEAASGDGVEDLTHRCGPENYDCPRWRSRPTAGSRQQSALGGCVLAPWSFRRPAEQNALVTSLQTATAPTRTSNRGEVPYAGRGGHLVAGPRRSGDGP
jgi:hypothetical protein